MAVARLGPEEGAAGGERVVRSIAWSAGPGCHGGSGVLLKVRDGILEDIEGDPAHPYNRGSLCPRALAMKEYVYHPDRLLHPLRRMGEHGIHSGHGA